MGLSLLDAFEKMLVFDVETTGFSAERNTIIEFGGVEIESGAGVRETDFLVQLPPRTVLPTVIVDLTGITRDRLKGEGIPQQDAAERIAGLLETPNLLMVAYNAQFDLSFLHSFLRRFGREQALGNAHFLDAMTVYKDRHPYPHKLENAVQAYHVTAQNTHRALDDARATWELLEKMGAEEDDLSRYVNLFGYHPKYGVAGERFPGITYLPQGYRRKGKLYGK